MGAGEPLYKLWNPVVYSLDRNRDARERRSRGVGCLRQRGGNGEHVYDRPGRLPDSQSSQGFFAGRCPRTSAACSACDAIYASVLGVFAIFVLASGDFLLVLAFGPKYAGYGLVMGVLALGMVALSMGLTAGIGLWAIERPQANLPADMCAIGHADDRFLPARTVRRAWCGPRRSRRQTRRLLGPLWDVSATLEYRPQPGGGIARVSTISLTAGTLSPTRVHTAPVWLIIAVLSTAFYFIEHRNDQVSNLEAFTLWETIWRPDRPTATWRDDWLFRGLPCSGQYCWHGAMDGDWSFIRNSDGC